MFAQDLPSGGRRWSWRRVVVKCAGLSLAIAILLEAALWMMWWYSSEGIRSFMGDWLVDLYLPAVFLAISLAGNPHSLNEAVAFSAELLQTFLMVFLLSIAFATARHLAMRRQRRTR